MSVPQAITNRSYRGIFYLVGLVVLILLVIDVFAIGGDTFLFNLHSSLNAPLAIVVTVFAASIWRYMGAEVQRRRMWTGLVLGWGAWALAETIWAVFSLLGQEVPYPSPADLFWVLGYIPMGIGLLARLRNTVYQPTRRQRYSILVVSAVTFAVVFVFIFFPIIQDFDVENLVTSVLNILYPFADLFVLSIIWWMFLTYEKGEAGIAWRLITIGFLLMTFSDLFFTYGDWQGIYYPDMQATLFSRLVVDFPYTVSYLVWIAGIYALRRLRIEEKPVETVLPPRRLPTYGHVLVYTDSEDKVLSVSPNFERLFANMNVRGKTLAEALSISEQEEQTVVTKLRFSSKITDLPVHIRDRTGAMREVKLCGIAPLSTRREYAGANLVLRLPIEDTTFDMPLSQESRGLMKYLLDRSESQYQVEVRQFLLDYYLPFFRLLLQMVFDEGGEGMAQLFMDELQQTALERNWPLRFDPGSFLVGEYPVAILRQALPVLLERAVEVASRMTDPKDVEVRMGVLRTQFGEDVHTDLARLLARAGN